MGRMERMERTPPRMMSFPNITACPKLTLVFMKLHELHLSFVPFPQELRIT
jgi:hypothetical protein